MMGLSLFGCILFARGASFDWSENIISFRLLEVLKSESFQNSAMFAIQIVWCDTLVKVGIIESWMNCCLRQTKMKKCLEICGFWNEDIPSMNANPLKSLFSSSGTLWNWFIQKENYKRILGSQCWNEWGMEAIEKRYRIFIQKIDLI